MSFQSTISLPSRSYFEALEIAERRSLHSFFDQHVVEDDEAGLHCARRRRLQRASGASRSARGAYRSWRNARRILKVPGGQETHLRFLPFFVVRVDISAPKPERRNGRWPAASARGLCS